MRNTVLYGNCLEKLKEVPDACIQTCVTSPPYFGLRDYEVEGQIGREETPQEYVEKLVQVFREVWRVLRDNGTLWVNLGDSYANDTKWGGSTSGKHVQALHGNTGVGRNKQKTGIAPKNLIGIPWRVAFALQDDGWTLRSDIIWEKPNCMPESVKDRVTRSHEYVFFLSKRETYFDDAGAIRESTRESQMLGTAGTPDEGFRNKRSVWTINTQPYSGAHFAVMPPDLARPCIMAGSKEGDLVLDPFAGSGTTLQVAKDLNRDYIGIEINESYRPLIEGRTKAAAVRAGERSIYQWMLDGVV